MKLRSIFPVSAFIAFAAMSCTPYVEPAPDAPDDPAQRTVSAEEQQKIKERREKLKEEQAAADRDRAGDQTADKLKERPDGTTAGGGDTPKPKEQPVSIPVAHPIPGKPGMVFSPFNNKPVDVKGIPSGKLVYDPHYPQSENKKFRVP